MKNNLIVNDINVDSIGFLKEKIENNGNAIDEIVNSIVDTYCESLDSYMLFVRSLLDDGNNPPSNKELDDIVLNIPVLLYFVGTAQETLGIKEDIAKAVRQEVFNEAYGIGLGTVGDKNSFAELQSQNETIIYTAYQRAYKKIKSKMENANETLQSAKKVISRRMAEYELSKNSNNSTNFN